MQRFTLNTEQVNRYGFRVLTSGLALENFKANPVMFYSHDRSKLPIGTWKDIRVENGKLTAEPDFDESDPFALQIKDKVEKGILKAASINFNITATSDKDADLLAGQTYPTVTHCEPWEASIVDIPGNPGCMRLSYRGVEIGGDLSLTLDSIMKPISNHKQISTHKMKEIALALGLKAEATEDEIASAIVSLRAEKKEPAKAAAASADDNLTASLVAIGRRTGFVTDSNEATIKALAAIDFANTLKLVSEAPAASTGVDASKSKTESLAAALAKLGGSQGKESDKGIPSARADWSIRKWEKEDPKGLGKLRAENPETYKELFYATYKA